jgi:hypothetical protein
MAAMTVRQFIFQMYRLINASNPTTPLHGDLQNLALSVLNQLMDFYSSTGLMLTIAKTITASATLGMNIFRFVDDTYPTNEIQTEQVILTTLSPDFTVMNGSNYTVGDLVTGNGIPANTNILSIYFNTVTLSNSATITGPSNLTFTSPIVVPSVTFVTEGRIANIDSAWLQLNGVTYPLIYKSRDDFLAAWKYEPLQGLPRFIIAFPNTNYVDVQLYPAPSQSFDFFLRGKFQLAELTINSDMSHLPQYYIRYFLFAVSREVALYTGRADAWTDKLELRYQEAYDIMAASSEVNLSISGDEQSLLNGAWRVRAGI